MLAVATEIGVFGVTGNAGSDGNAEGAVFVVF